jgi:hypothetical protein
MSGKSERVLKNYLFDNPQLKETKASSCLSSNFDNEDEFDIWMLQCPKSIDASSLLNCKLGNSKSQTIEFDAEKFEKAKALMVIKPEKAEEYELICDNVKIVSLFNQLTSGSELIFIHYSTSDSASWKNNSKRKNAGNL